MAQAEVASEAAANTDQCRIIFDDGNKKTTLLRVDGVSFIVKSRFTGTDRLSDLLLAAAQNELNKIPQNADFMGSERGGLCYNRSGS